MEQQVLDTVVVVGQGLELALGEEAGGEPVRHRSGEIAGRTLHLDQGTPRQELVPGPRQRVPPDRCGPVRHLPLATEGQPQPVQQGRLTGHAAADDAGEVRAQPEGLTAKKGRPALDADLADPGPGVGPLGHRDWQIGVEDELAGGVPHVRNAQPGVPTQKGLAQGLECGTCEFQERKAVAERPLGGRRAGVGQLDGIAAVIEGDAASLEGVLAAFALSARSSPSVLSRRSSAPWM